MAGFVTAVAALVGALAAAGVLPLGDGDEPGTPRPAAGTGQPAATVVATRFEQGCLRFWGDPPSVCACFGAAVVDALPAAEVDAASRLFRSDGRFATVEQDELALDVRAGCRAG